MHYDEVLHTLGEFGHYQKVRFLLLCIYSLVAAWHSLNMVFVGAVPDHYCDVGAIEDPALANLTSEELTAIFVPKGDNCRVYDIDETLALYQLESNFSSIDIRNTSLETCPGNTVYSTEQYTATIVSDFGLVCAKKSWMGTSKSVYFFGRLCGAIVFGQISDRFGRRPTFILCIALLLLAGSVASAAPNIEVFLPMYFLQGAAQTGAFLVAFIQATEIVGPSYRVLVGFLIQVAYTFGYISLAGLSYGLRHWRHIEVAITVPTVFFVLYWWLLPESVRWLLSQKRDEEAKAILEKMARENKKVLPPDVIKRLREDEDRNSSDKERKYTILDLVRTCKMAKLSLGVWFNWLVNALVYYGLSLNTENLAGNPYLNFCIAGAVEIPAYVICILLLNRVGRRWPLIVTMCIGGVACILSGCIPVSKGTEIVPVVLAMIGKFGITASYGIIYLMGAEVFPTVVRNIGMGMSSMSARIGGILAPQILELRGIATPLPLVVFGALSVLAGFLAFFLPETLNRRLPQGLDDVTQSRKLRCCNTTSDDDKSDVTEMT